MMDRKEANMALAIIDDDDASRSDVAVAIEVLRRVSDSTLSDLLCDARNGLGYLVQENGWK
jgi:hypothetical protein